MRYFLFFIIGLNLGIWFKRPPIRNGDIIQITKLYEANDYIDSINNGGCGFFALKLISRLDTSRYKIVCINGKEHIAIKDSYRDMFLDSKGYHTKYSYDLRYDYPEYQEISIEKLRFLVYNTPWNKSFKIQDTVCINTFIESL